MPSTEDFAVRRAVVTAVDALPQAPADLRARTLARFHHEAGALATVNTLPGRRVVALTLGFLPAIVALPLAATLGIERPVSIQETLSAARSVQLLSKLLRIA